MHNTADVTLGNLLNEYIFEHFKDIISIKDLNGRYRVCNKNFLNTFGFEKQNQILGKTIDEIILPELIFLPSSNIINTIKNEDEYVLKNKKTINIERTEIDKNGKSYRFRIHKAPLFDNKPPFEIKGLITIEENIDKKYSVENQKDLFVATLTHDLKNPVIALTKNIKLFQKNIKNYINEEHNELLNLIIETVSYMQELIYSILKVYKENQGIIKLKKEYFNINELVKTGISEIKALAEHKGITINFCSELDEPNKIFYADKIQIKRVFSNLLNNAISYAFDNTEITIKIKKVSDKIIYTIQNISPVIDKTLETCIFEKFFCGNNILSTGLGLYFCKKAIEAHEGYVYLKTNKTENTFVVELPILDENYVSLNEIVL